MPRTHVPAKASASRERVFADRSRCETEAVALADKKSKLNAYGTYQLSKTGGLLCYMDAEDLAQEALLLTFDGTRGWEPEQGDFASHQYGCIKSICHNLRKRTFRRIDAEQEFERRTTLRQSQPRDASRIWDHVRAFSKKANDLVALQVLELMLAEMTRAEIIDLLQIRREAYDAARKRIYRRAKHPRVYTHSSYRRPQQSRFCSQVTMQVTYIQQLMGVALALIRRCRQCVYRRLGVPLRKTA